MTLFKSWTNTRKDKDSGFENRFVIVTAGNDSDRNSLNDVITFSFCHFRFAFGCFFQCLFKKHS